MHLGKAAFAGVLGAIMMTGITALGRVIGFDVNMEMLLGSMVAKQVGSGPWTLGLMMHLVAGGIFGALYGFIFYYGFHRGGTYMGLMLGGIHALLSGLLMGLMPMMHPLIPEGMAAPGMFMSEMGAAGVVAFIALHVIYGSVVGWIYGDISVASEMMEEGRGEAMEERYSE